MTKLKSVYTAPNAQVAALLEQRLAEQGIRSTVSDPYPHPPGIATEPRVLVSGEDYKPARAIAEEFEQELRHDTKTPEAGSGAEEELDAGDRAAADDEVLQIDDDGWSGWPLCEQCRVRRQTVCPVCNSAGSDFPLADDVEPAPQVGEQPLDGEFQVRDALLMCERCEEAFKPEFYRHCHACGHDHERGRESPPVDAEEELSPRATIVVLGLALLAIGSFAYFWFVLR